MPFPLYSEPPKARMTANYVLGTKIPGGQIPIPSSLRKFQTHYLCRKVHSTICLDLEQLVQDTYDARTFAVTPFFSLTSVATTIHNQAMTSSAAQLAGSVSSNIATR